MQHNTARRDATEGEVARRLLLRQEYLWPGPLAHLPHLAYTVLFYHIIVYIILVYYMMYYTVTIT